MLLHRAAPPLHTWGHRVTFMRHVLPGHMRRDSQKGSLCLCSGGAMRPLSDMGGEEPQGTGAHKTTALGQGHHLSSMKGPRLHPNK